MIRIREAKLNDVSSIAKIHVNTRRLAYNNIIPNAYLMQRTIEVAAENWTKRLKKMSSSEYIFVAVNKDNEVLGFCSVSKENDDERYEGFISTLYVSYEYQHQGIGKMLFMAAINKLQDNGIYSMMLWVFADNSARKFYEMLGGKVVKEKIVVYGKEILEVAYGWENTKDIVNPTITLM